MCIAPRIDVNLPPAPASGRTPEQDIFDERNDPGHYRTWDHSPPAIPPLGRLPLPHPSGSAQIGMMERRPKQEELRRPGANIGLLANRGLDQRGGEIYGRSPEAEAYNRSEAFNRWYFEQQRIKQQEDLSDSYLIHRAQAEAEKRSAEEAAERAIMKQNAEYYNLSRDPEGRRHQQAQMDADFADPADYTTPVKKPVKKPERKRKSHVERKDKHEPWAG